ncbi:MAG: hypothetical protein ABL960_13855 [Nitrospira sp.]|nr:MAG: hypothetical protein E8D44_02090 [Nitrospira sp.]
MIEAELRPRWVEWIVETFQNRPCVFGTLVYSRKPNHPTPVPKSVHIYTEQVMRRSCKSHPEPLRRVFIAEQTSGEEIRKTRVHPIPMNGEVRHLLIRQPRIQEAPALSSMPDIPHIHFLMEVPHGVSCASFESLCKERWNRMNGNPMNLEWGLAKVEVVKNLSAATSYITKDFVKTQGENIILTHATALIGMKT